MTSPDQMVLSDDDRAFVEAGASRNYPAAEATLAPIVLLAADGQANAAIAEDGRFCPDMARKKWRVQFRRGGLEESLAHVEHMRSESRLLEPTLTPRQGRSASVPEY